MGISGLLSLLKSIQRPCNLQKFNGLTLGVDAYVWLHRGTVACAIDLALDKPTAKFVEFAMNRVRMLIHFGITPYLVFDGNYLPSKAVTEEERAKRREHSKALGLQLYRAGKIAQAQTELQKAVDVTPEMAGQLIEELRKHNIKFVVAPYEADAQLVYLERKGIIQGIISEDSDLLVFGAQRLVTKLDQYGDCVEINRNQFTACKGVSLVGWTDAEFRCMAILSGCDYLPNVNKLGLKTAYSLVRKYNSIERIIQRLRFDAKYSVPTDYLENFRRAELTFLHQWVFCPEAKKLVMGTPLEKCEFDELDFLGKDLDPTIARAVAAGRLHPATKQPLVAKIVPLRHSQSPWGATGKAQLATPIGKVGKPIDQYFKNHRVPLAELDPNTFTPSPSQQVLRSNANRSWLSSPASNTPIVPTPPVRSPATIGPPLRANGAHPRFGSVPSKRPRLCSEEDDASGGNSVDMKSPFFSSRAPKPSPFLSQTSRGKTKKESVNIWSDDSIDEVLEELPDLSIPLSPRVEIYRDKACNEPAGVSAPMKTIRNLKSQPSILTEASASVASTQATAASLLESQRTSDKVSKAQPEAGSDSSKSNSSMRLDLVHFPALPTSHDEVVPESPREERRLVQAKHHSAERHADESNIPSHCTVSGSEDLLIPQSDDESPPESPSEGPPERPKLDLGRFLFTG